MVSKSGGFCSVMRSVEDPWTGLGEPRDQPPVLLNTGRTDVARALCFLWVLEKEREAGEQAGDRAARGCVGTGGRRVRLERVQV
jgi:hypothetical protein